MEMADHEYRAENLAEHERSVAKAFAHFFSGGQIHGVKVLSGGAINYTYLVSADAGIFIVQSLSAAVFGDRLCAIEENYRRFKEALSEARAARAAKAEGSAGDVSLAVPEWIADEDGRYVWRSDDGTAWRIYPYIPGHTLSCDDPNAVEVAARAVAEMHRILGYYPGKPETVIPDFHRIDLYYESYNKTIKALDNCKTSEKYCEHLIAENIDYILKNCVIEGNAVIHGDTKIANVLYDDDTGHAAFIDLDTFSVGSPLVDVADSVRSILSRGDDVAELAQSRSCEDGAAAEQLPGDDDVTVNAVCQLRDDGADSMYDMEQFVKEYYRALGRVPSDVEKRDLMHMIIRMPFELGLRFYTDHLKGNTYFPVERDGENLLRARKQFGIFELLKASFSEQS